MIAERRRLFANHLAMRLIAGKFVDCVRNVIRPKKRLLFVTARYTEPSLGGAEAMLAALIAAVSDSNEFAVDVIAPEVLAVSEAWRFGSSYEFGHSVSATVGLLNVRFARFVVPKHDAFAITDKLVAAWRAQ